MIFNYLCFPFTVKKSKKLDSDDESDDEKIKIPNSSPASTPRKTKKGKQVLSDDDDDEEEAKTPSKS